MAELHTPDKAQQHQIPPLPAFAASALNRCNLPAVVLGGCTFQQHPVPLMIDGVQELHREFFLGLEAIESAQQRALHFRQYMCSAFLLDHTDEAGFSENSQGVKRAKSDYLRLLRGWMFSADSIEAAVLKRWVESRFGLRAIKHHGWLGEGECDAYERYHTDYVRGLYNSNALESQLDLLYSYCQYELKRRWPERTHWQLYRGINHMDEHLLLAASEKAQPILLLNNLNSFTCDRFLSESFGDVILKAQVPVAKLIYFPELLDGVLKGEGEFLALGGVYQATILP